MSQNRQKIHKAAPLISPMRMAKSTLHAAPILPMWMAKSTLHTAPLCTAYCTLHPYALHTVAPDLTYTYFAIPVGEICTYFAVPLGKICVLPFL